MLTTELFLTLWQKKSLLLANFCSTCCDVVNVVLFVPLNLDMIKCMQIAILHSLVRLHMVIIICNL